MTAVQKSDFVGISHTAMYRNPALVTAAGLVCIAAALILFAWLAGEVREGEGTIEIERLVRDKRPHQMVFTR